jgi:hypothetical protein
MKIVELGNDRTHDVDGQKFGVMLKETDLHSSKELSSIKCMNRILTGKSELKAQDKTLKTLFIEHKEDTFNNGTFKPSGLSTTEAGTWRINIRRLVIEVDTNFLRFCYDNREFFNFRPSTSAKRGPKCTGFLIPVCDILDLHNMWEDYDAGDDFEMCYARYFDDELFRKLIFIKNKKP